MFRTVRTIYNLHALYVHNHSDDDDDYYAMPFFEAHFTLDDSF